MVKASVSNIVVVVAALLIGRCSADFPPPPVITQVVYDTIAPTALLDSVRAMRMQADGLQAKIAARSRVLPERIIVTDTFVTPPDTVLQAVTLRGTNLSIAPLIRFDSAGWRPEIHRFNVAGCDDGFSWAAGELVCDRARFGHLSPFVAFGVEREQGYAFGASVGLGWTPSNASPWVIGVELDAKGVGKLGVVREWRLW